MMESISKYQLAAMIILFEIGSSILFEIGVDAKQDAWLVVLASVIAGLIPLIIYFNIQSREKEKNLISLLNQYFGSFLGKTLSILYVIFFTYESMRNVRDFGDITIMTFLSKTPISIIMLIMILLSIYAIFQGIEVFFRVVEFMLPGVLLFHLIIIIMFFSSDIVQYERLLPVLENGIKPILKTSIKDAFFPFGQMGIFLMFWSYLNEKHTMVKTTLIAYFIVGLLLVVHNWLNIAILGTTYTTISNIPFLASVQLIQIADFLERFDPFVVLLMYVYLFAKATLWYLAAVLGLAQILNMKDRRKLIFPIGVLIYGASFLEPNWVYHIWLGTEAAKWINPIFIIIIPTLLLLVMILKSKLREKNDMSTT